MSQNSLLIAKYVCIFLLAFSFNLKFIALAGLIIFCAEKNRHIMHITGNQLPETGNAKCAVTVGNTGDSLLSG